MFSGEEQLSTSIISVSTQSGWQQMIEGESLPFVTEFCSCSLINVRAPHHGKSGPWCVRGLDVNFLVSTVCTLPTFPYELIVPNTIIVLNFLHKHSYFWGTVRPNTTGASLFAAWKAYVLSSPNITYSNIYLEMRGNSCVRLKSLRKDKMLSTAKLWAEWGPVYLTAKKSLVDSSGVTWAMLQELTRETQRKEGLYLNALVLFLIQ